MFAEANHAGAVRAMALDTRATHAYAEDAKAIALISAVDTSISITAGLAHNTILLCAHAVHPGAAAKASAEYSGTCDGFAPHADLIASSARCAAAEDAGPFRNGRETYDPLLVALAVHARMLVELQVVAAEETECSAVVGIAPNRAHSPMISGDAHYICEGAGVYSW
jgi:hypothetical protein